MKFQVALWIFIMGINISLNKVPKRHCYQADKVYKKDETIPKIRAPRSLSRYGHDIKPKQSGVCSTWGNFHYRTFDGEIYRFPGICNYLFASHCGKHIEDFNIQIEQSWDKRLPAISQLSVKINDLLIEVIDHIPSVHGKILELPYSNNGIRIDKTDTGLQITAKLLLELTWEESNTLHLTISKKYMGETCGLCGNYNGNATDDLVSNGVVIDPLMFGMLQKFRKPNENCEDPKPEITKKCHVYRSMCLKNLRNQKWVKCNRLVNPEPYVKAYILDMCLCNATAEYQSFCLCNTITEYSRQCALAGGKPPDWRNPNMCYKPCPANLIFKECSPPCISTCSNPGQHYFCDGPCVPGCVCPKGFVMDDITNLGCIHVQNCSCTYNNEIYPPGSVYNTTCSTCSCFGGHWNCQEIPCPSTCAVEGGSHITTYDKIQYTFHGKCIYVLTKPCADSTFSVNIELKKCAYSESGTCLKRVFLFLDDGSYEFEIKYDNDFPHVTFDKKIMAQAGVSVCWQSSFYLIVYTNKGLYLQVQLLPVMQLYVVVDPSYKKKLCGLCGDFNSIQKDDFRTSSGALESNVIDFANSWKTNFKCHNIKHIHEHPCIYGMEIEKYANYWCNILLDTVGPFAACHSSVSPEVYQQNCLFDTCACKRAEDCLCAAISSYVWACATAGIQLIGWRADVCRNFLYHCPPSFVYSYIATTCIPTCRSLSEPDPTCCIKFHTVDGCVCPNGTYLNDRGFCVKREDCPCYYMGVPVSANEPLNVGRLICNCIEGKIHCTDKGIQECLPPMVYYDCETAGEAAKGIECSQTCDTSTVQCYSPLCVSGCLCPNGLFLSENITCIKEEQCPCVHNGRNYNSGDVATIRCNQCVCRNRTWVCDNKAENGKCTVYGEGHYITFDNKRYTINGDCGYTLVQDYCDFDHLWKGTFKVISENIPCGTTGTSCSKAIIVYLGAHKLILADEDLRVEERSSKVEITYKTRRMGLFLIIETKIGLVLVWDRKTTIYIYLSTNFKGKVCGLCGNFDDNSKNDFTTRSQCVVEDVKQFRDSWKFSPYCPEVYMSRDPCVANPYRIAWAQKLCNIILSRVFASCHSEVDPEKYYEACIKDTCACDMGGDCDCYCTAVSAYAQACSEACVCIEWRSPTICPLFCDFYNKEGQCDWHYMSCGGHCMKTCRNPNGLCTSNLKGLEGCYPKCPEDKPYFNEDEMQCVAQCGCLDKEDNYYKVGEKVESCSICEICICTSNGIVCHYDSKVCNCQYEGQFMEIGDVIQVNDSSGGCKKVHCGLNGTFETPCYKTAETTTGLLKTTTLLSTLSTTKEIQETSTLRESFSTLTPEVTTESSTTKIPEISTTSTASPQSTIFTTEITTFPTTKLSTALTSAITSPPPSSSLSSTAASSRTTTVPFTSQFPTTTTEFTEISDAIMTDIDLPRTKPNTAHSSRTSIHSTSKFTTTVMKSSSSQLPVYIFSPVTVTPNKAYNTNCVNITCHENGTFEVIELQCPVVQNITCEGESPPLKIYDQNGCCYHYECAHCVGPQGMIKNPGETWIDNCHYCTCDKYFEKDLIKVKITCNHVKCPPLNFSACDETWLKLYLIFTEEDPCCEKIECRCEPSQCQYQAEICSLGFEAVPTVMEGECCVKINCIPMNVCIVDGAVYQIGQDISTNRSSCKTCSCSEEKDPETGFNIVVCEPILCMILCPQGYVYETSNNDCCGKCIQVSCVVIAADGSSHLLKPGESQFLPDDNCTQYTCNFKGNIFVISSQTQVCPSTDEEECMSGLLENTPDGCCSICKAPKTCRIQTNVTEISQNGCSAHVSLSYCEGWCPSLRKFSEMSFQMEGKCVCCLETKTTEIEVELICPGDIDNIKITMSSAENCACTAGTCTT